MSFGGLFIHLDYDKVMLHSLETSQLSLTIRGQNNYTRIRKESHDNDALCICFKGWKNF